MSVMASQWADEFDRGDLGCAGYDSHFLYSAVRQKLDDSECQTLSWADFCAVFSADKGPGETPGVQATQAPQVATLPWVRELYVRMDRDGNGTIARQELIRYLQGDAEA